MRCPALQLHLFADAAAPEGVAAPPGTLAPDPRPEVPAVRSPAKGGRTVALPHDASGGAANVGGFAVPSAADLHAYLVRELGQAVHLTLTRNERRWATWIREGGRLRVRVVARAVQRGPRVWDALVHWIRHPGRASTRSLLDALQPGPDEAPPHARTRRTRIWTQGKVFDLEALLARENEARFGGRFDGRITWGAAGRPAGRRRRHVRLGSWDDKAGLVRIHPCLDRPDVPECVIATTIHHELLHWELGIERQGGRRRLHTPEFRRREACHPDHERAEAWIRANLSRL